MGKGAVHITGSNFALRRRLRWDILDRMRKLVENGTYERPRWLEWVEQAPPLETRNLIHSERIIKNPYIPLIETLLRKYPHLRFEQCYNEENKWQKGFDEYTANHPVMQFVAHQLSLMNKGINRHDAFIKTENLFYKRRMEIENRIKIAMALAIDEGAKPLYTTGFAYWQSKIADDNCKILVHIRNHLRKLKEAAIASKKVKDSV